MRHPILGSDCVQSLRVRNYVSKVQQGSGHTVCLLGLTVQGQSIGPGLRAALGAAGQLQYPPEKNYVSQQNNKTRTWAAAVAGTPEIVPVVVESFKPSGRAGLT